MTNISLVFYGTILFVYTNRTKINRSARRLSARLIKSRKKLDSRLSQTSIYVIEKGYLTYKSLEKNSEFFLLLVKIRKLTQSFSRVVCVLIFISTLKSSINLVSLYCFHYSLPDDVSLLQIKSKILAFGQFKHDVIEAIKLLGYGTYRLLLELSKTNKFSSPVVHPRLTIVSRCSAFEHIISISAYGTASIIFGYTGACVEDNLILTSLFSTLMMTSAATLNMQRAALDTNPTVIGFSGCLFHLIQAGFLTYFSSSLNPVIISKYIRGGLSLYKYYYSKQGIKTPGVDGLILICVGTMAGIQGNLSYDIECQVEGLPPGYFDWPWTSMIRILTKYFFYDLKVEIANF